MVRRGSTDLVEVLPLNWSLWLGLGICHKGFTAYVSQCVLCCFPQANLHILITGGEQITQDL